MRSAGVPEIVWSWDCEWKECCDEDLRLACLAVPLSGCGNWISVNYAGQLGLTVDESGQPVVAVMTCSKETPVIDMYEGRKKSDPGSKENVRRGLWQSRRAFSGVEMLALTAPGASWKTSISPGPLEADRLFIVEGGTAEDKNGDIIGFNFRTSELAALSPGRVRVNLDKKTMSLKAFGAYKCPE